MHRLFGTLGFIALLGACASVDEGTSNSATAGGSGGHVAPSWSSRPGPLAGVPGTMPTPAGAGSPILPGRPIPPGFAGRPGGAAGAGIPGIPPDASGFPGAAGVPAPGAMGAAGVPAPGAMGAAGMSAMPAAGAAPPAPTGTGDRATVEGVCARWKADRADLSEGTWSGDVASCNNGDISPEGRANALRSLNLYRWLAGLDPVTTDPAMDKQAQACALLQRANGSLSHNPPMEWMCWNDEGSKAAGRCNISSGPGVSSVDGYMIDPGNPTTIGHRRWILSNSFGPTGLGSTDRHSCMMTFGNSRAGKPWMAWPSPGIIPIQATVMGQGQWSQKIDMTGWTVQSDMINLSSAQVTVTSGGMPMPVTVTQLMGGYGSRYAFRFNPMGWSTEAGKTYSVAVTGIPQPINYDVQIVDCK